MWTQEKVIQALTEFIKSEGAEMKEIRLGKDSHLFIKWFEFDEKGCLFECEEHLHPGWKPTIIASRMD